MLFLLVWYMLLSVLFGLVFLLLQDTPFAGRISVPWILILMQFAGLILPLAVYLRQRNHNLLHYMPNKALDTYSLVLVVMISFLFQPAMMFISGVSSLFLPNPAAEAMYIMSDIPFMILVLAVAVTPAFCEEIVFRGYIQSNQEFMGIKKAAVINGLFFGMIHMNLHQFFYAFAMGIVFAYLVYYSRSIQAGILAHFIVNATQITIGRWIIAIYPYQETSVDPAVSPFRAMAALGMIALIFTSLGLLLLNIFINHNKNRNLQHDMNSPAEDIPVIEPLKHSTKLIKDPFFIVALLLWAGYMLLLTVFQILHS